MAYFMNHVIYYHVILNQNWHMWCSYMYLYFIRYINVIDHKYEYLYFE